MADLLRPVIPPKIREKMFRQHEIFVDDFSDKELQSKYRFGWDSIEFLTEILENDLQRRTKRNHGLSPTLQFLVALHFFVSSSFLQPSVTPSASQNSLSQRVVKDVSLALARKQKKFILWPFPVELQVVKRGFYDKRGFPGVIGCINGTHVRIQAPSTNENNFVNQKGFHSNVQAVCKRNGRQHKAKINESFMLTMWLPSRKIFIQGKGLVTEAIFWEGAKFLLFWFCFCFFCWVKILPLVFYFLNSMIFFPHRIHVFGVFACWWCYFSTLTELYQYFCAYFVLWEIFHK